jgi:hypothetical protein
VKKENSGIRALFPSCRQVSQMQSDSTPRSFAQRLGLKFHLLVCGWCRRYGRQVRFLQHFVHDDQEHETARTPLSGEAKERLKQSLRQNSSADSL